MNVEKCPHLANRTELFVDDSLIESLENVCLQLHTPQAREVVWQMEKAWEGVTSAYFTLLSDGETIRLYYRGFDNDNTCMALSYDGIHFERPSLGLYEFDGSKQNNIVYRGPDAHNFAPFIDHNPEAPTGERYKSLCGPVAFPLPPEVRRAVERDKGISDYPAGYPLLYALVSPDGIHWRRAQEKPVMTRGGFDSQNVAFYDQVAGIYRCYSRLWTLADGSVTAPGGETVGDGVRAIQHSTSRNFIDWTQPEPLRYPAGTPIEHFYTNAVHPVPSAPHILLAFPMRFCEERKKVEEHLEQGISDTMLMSSRDGQFWNREFMEAWIRPGLDRCNWTDRSNMTARGIIQTSPEEYSCYVTEHFRWPDNRLRRYSIRKDGFSSVRAKRQTGTVTMKPLTLDGDSLFLNYSTSASGFVQVEICDVCGRALEPFTLAQSPQLYGDEIQHQVQWNGNPSLTSLKGREVRIRFVLADADIFSFRVV